MTATKPKPATFRFTCKTCGSSWTRTFQHEADVQHYLLMRTICVTGCHVADPSLADHATYVRIK
jgi:transposase-like protein